MIQSPNLISWRLNQEPAERKSQKISSKIARNPAASNLDEHFDHYTGNYGCDTKCELCKQFRSRSPRILVKIFLSSNRTLNGFPFSSHDDSKILGDDFEQDFCKSIRSSLFSKKTLKKTRQILDQYSRKIKLGNNFNFSSYSRNLPMDDFDPRR